MYGYNAEPPIAIPIYTVLPYCVISTVTIVISHCVAAMLTSQLTVHKHLQSVMVSTARSDVDCSSPLVKRHTTTVLLFSSITGTVNTPDTVSPSGPTVTVIPLESGRELTFSPLTKNARDTDPEQLKSTDPDPSGADTFPGVSVKPVNR